MGVHITFVRSTELDSWSWDQLRIMKVGGNAAASDFFNKHGSSAFSSKDPKSKYSSSVAISYKEQLKDLAQYDAELFPDRVVLEQSEQDGQDADSASGQAQDFFNEANYSRPGSATLGNLMQQRTGSGSSIENAATNRVSPPKKPIGVKKIAATKVSKLGAKKADIPINFDEIEAKAKEEEKRLAKLEMEKMEQQMRESELARERLIQQQKEQLSKAPEPIKVTGGGVGSKFGGISATSPVDKEKDDVLERLGMGFGRVNFNSATSTG